MAVTLEEAGVLLPNGGARFVALMTTLPTTGGVGGVELSGGGYARVEHSAWIDESVGADITRKNNGAIEFPTVTVDVGPVVGWAMYTAATGGVLVAFGPLVALDGETETQRAFRAGDAPRFVDLEMIIGGTVVGAALTWTDRTAAASSTWWRTIWAAELGLFVAISTAGAIMTSPDGVTWTTRTAPEANLWYDVAWAPGLSLLVACALSGTNRFMKSSNGTSWTAVAAPSGAWGAIAWSESLGLFVAFNQSTTSMATSPDGDTWTTVTGVDGDWSSALWVEELLLFVAVGTLGVIQTSPDGSVWTSRTSPVTHLRRVAWSPELGLLVATRGTSPAHDTVAVSEDGVTWTAVVVPSGIWRDVAWTGELFVLLGYSGHNAYSLDGYNWLMGTAVSSKNWESLAYSPSLDLLAAVSSSGTGTARAMSIASPSLGAVEGGTAEIDIVDELSLPKVQALMPPGLAWVRDSDTILTSFLRALAYSFARVSRRALDLLEEVDPRTTYELLEDWERVYGLPDECATPTTLAGRRAALLAKVNGNEDPSKANIIAAALELGYDLLIYEYKRAEMFTCESTCEDYLYTDQWMFRWDVAFWPGENDEQLYCAIEKVAPGHTYLLNSVRHWTPGDTIGVPTSPWRSVCWSSVCRKFVAVSTTGTDQVMTSAEGREWTARTAAAANLWICVIWSEELGLFIACSTNGTNRIMTSPDGVTWTSRALTTTSSWQSLAYSPALNLVVAVASTGTNRVASSPDAITWTDRTAAEANAWQSVCWSPTLGLFCAVSSSGTNRVMTSPDGINWTARAAAEANDWQSVCWSEELGLFVACSLAGTHRFMTSPDGSTWTARTHPENAQYRNVIWAKELGAFVAMAIDASGSAFSLDGITWQVLDVGEVNSWYSVAWSPETAMLIAVASTGTNRVARIREQGGRRFYRALE